MDGMSGARVRAVAEWLAVSAMAGLVAGWLRDPDYRPFQTDYLEYFYPAGWYMLHGMSPYTFVTPDGQYGFMFPPWLALVLAPYAILPPDPAATCWLATNMLLVGASVALAARVCRVRLGVRRTLLITLVLLLWQPTQMHLDYGSSTLLVTASSL